MTKERLEEIEKETLYVGNSARERELTTEIRRCWAEIRQLTSDLREIRQMYGSLQAKETRYWAEMEELKRKLMRRFDPEVFNRNG